MHPGLFPFSKINVGLLVLMFVLRVMSVWQMQHTAEHNCLEGLVINGSEFYSQLLICVPCPTAGAVVFHYVRSRYSAVGSDPGSDLLWYLGCSCHNIPICSNIHNLGTANGTPTLKITNLPK